MAISRAREAVRASSRFATFTHATSSTMPTAPSSTSNESRAAPLTTSFSGLMRNNAVALRWRFHRVEFLPRRFHPNPRFQPRQHAVQTPVGMASEFRRRLPRNPQPLRQRIVYGN